MKPLNTFDEMELLQRFRDGDERAFTMLYEQYHPSLYLYTYKLTNDEDDAADMVQDLFIYLWARRNQLTFSTSFRAYLYRSIRHKFLNLTKHHQVRRNFQTQFQAYLNGGEDTTANQIEENELFEHLDQLIQNLPPQMARVYNLRQANLSDTEISTQLGISEKTVKNLMSAAIKNLKTVFRSFLFLIFLLY